MASTIPRLIARLEITNAQGQFDSQPPGATRGDGLDVARISFSVTKTLSSTPNTGEISIYNLSDATIEKITGTVRKRIEFTAEEKAQLLAAGASAAPIEVTYDNAGLASVRLSWGYAGQDQGSAFPPMSVGFIGCSSSMREVSDGLTKRLVIQAEDGGQLLGAARLKKAYKAGANFVDILVDLINACGVTVDRERLKEAMEAALRARSIPATSLTTLRGYNASTQPAATLIKTIMDGLGLRWSIQDGEFLLLDSDTVLAGYPPIILSNANYSLFGNPESLEAGQKRASTWATAEARPGRQVTIVSDNVEAQYRIDSVTHRGDTYSGGSSELTLDAIQVIPGVF